MRRLPLCFLLLAACGGPATDAEPDRVDWTGGDETPADDPLADVPGRAPTLEERDTLDRLSRIAERLRGLSFQTPVPSRIQSRAVITEFVQDQVEEEELERSRVFYVALGLLPPDLDIRELLVRVLGEQIVGYYDPEQSLLVIREDVMQQLDGASAQGLGEAEMVIVHELVHALQDQRLELGERYEDERTIDADNAFAALVEGDATLAMIGHMVESQGQPLRRLTANPAFLRMVIQQNPTAMQGQEIETAPPIVRLPLVSRYLDGMLFCATLHGQLAWRGVDEAHRRVPTSTEQVLHPEAWAAMEGPEPIALPELPALEAAGWAPFEEDTLGELEMGIWFGLGHSEERDAAAAAGWGGDRLRVYRRESGETAVVWFTTWDDEGEAAEAKLAAQAVASQTGTPHRVAQRGRAVLVLRDVPADLQDGVVQAFDAFASALPPAPPRGG